MLLNHDWRTARRSTQVLGGSLASSMLRLCVVVTALFLTGVAANPASDAVAELREHFRSGAHLGRNMSRAPADIAYVLLAENNEGEVSYCLTVQNKPASEGLLSRLREIGQEAASCPSNPEFKVDISVRSEPSPGRFVATYSYHCGPLCAGEGRLTNHWSGLAELQVRGGTGNESKDKVHLNHDRRTARRSTRVLGDPYGPRCMRSRSLGGLLPFGKMAVYVFAYGDLTLKVGKAGPNSDARYRSQHYDATRAASTLAGSLLKGADEIGIADLNQENVGAWIRANTTRTNFLLARDYGAPILTLLESFLQCRLKPVFEGFASQRVT